jgi:hypothetical protein
MHQATATTIYRVHSIIFRLITISSPHSSKATILVKGVVVVLDLSILRLEVHLNWSSIRFCFISRLLTVPLGNYLA